MVVSHRTSRTNERGIQLPTVTTQRETNTGRLNTQHMKLKIEDRQSNYKTGMDSDTLTLGI